MNRNFTNQYSKPIPSFYHTPPSPPTPYNTTMIPYTAKPSNMMSVMKSSTMMPTNMPKQIPSNMPTPMPSTMMPIPMSSTNMSNARQDNLLDIKYDVIEYANTVSPPVFGPPIWFTLHNAAAHYVNNPAPLARERMKNIILGIPILLPCHNCREHATAYIEKNYDNLFGW